MKILDCTFRDGGYYTNWDFPAGLVEKYVKSLANLPVDYLEVGYRSKPLAGYLGEFHYTPVQTIKKIKNWAGDKKLVLMCDEKNHKPEDMRMLFEPVRAYTDMVRIAVAPERITNARNMSQELKKMGYEVGLNVMYLSNIASDHPVFTELKGIENEVDYFYLVDSYGGLFPEQLKEKIALVRSHTKVPLGFHGHNNIELAFINTLTAIEEGIDIVDSTIMGMGRGAGNTKTELLLTYLESTKQLPVEFTYLGDLLEAFSILKEKYKWGTNLPYMISGANSLPQKDVMELMSKKRYTVSSIVQSMQPDKKNNNEFPLLSAVKNNYSQQAAIVIGGGASVGNHTGALKDLLEKHPGLLVIHSSSRNLGSFVNVPQQQILCLSGNEGIKLQQRIDGHDTSSISACVLPNDPNKMGVVVPEILLSKVYSCTPITFIDEYHDSPFAIALQSVIDLGIKEIMLCGFDGYDNQLTEFNELREESQAIIDSFIKSFKGEIYTVTPSSYLRLPSQSIYVKVS
jgi:4-hydroxy 2-oxovalerate aldolase